MTLQLKVPNMACSACGDTITKAIKAVDATATVTADPKTKLGIMSSSSQRMDENHYSFCPGALEPWSLIFKTLSIETEASETVVKQAITNAGYSVA